MNSIKLRPKYVLIGEPSSIYRVEIGEKGIFQYTVRADGFPDHVSISPFVGDNAILKLLNIGENLCKLVDTPVNTPEKLKDIVKDSGRVIASYFNKPELKKLFKSLSCNIGGDKRRG